MANRLQKQPVLTYVPAVPAIAARPAYCEQYQFIAGYNQVAGSPAVQQFIPIESLIVANGGTQVPSGASAVYRQISTINGQERVLIGYLINRPAVTSNRIPIYQTGVRCFSAIAGQIGSPARIDAFANLGWNAGARSIAQVPVGGYFDAVLPDDPLGVLIGLSDGASVHSYAHASHGLVARPSGITPVESGSDVGDEVAGGSVVRVARTTGGVKMYVDGVLIHESSNPVAGPAYVDATLYSLSDFVDSPVIGLFYETGGTASVSLDAEFAAIAGGTASLLIEASGVLLLDGVALTGAAAEMGIIAEVDGYALYELDAAGEASLTAELLGFTALGPNTRQSLGVSFAYGQMGMTGKALSGVTDVYGVIMGQGEFSRPVLDARMGRPEATVSQAVGVFPYPLLTANIVGGGVISGTGTMAMKGQASEGDYFGGTGVAATSYECRGWWSYLPEGQLDGNDLLFSIDTMRMDTIVLFVLHEDMQITDSLDLYLVISMELFEAVGISSRANLTSIIQLAINERMAISANAGAARREALQYAVNSITGALSTYQNFGFKQFARAGGITYAITDSGLYRMQGDTDDGDTLNAVIDFGASDYGTAQSKRISSVYAGIATDGEVYLRVTGDDGLEYIYRAEGGHEEKRAPTAKGLAARHWRLRLELTDASYADLDNIEVEIGVSQRRIRK